MKVAIFSQDVPIYIPELLYKFIADNQNIEFGVYCFNGYENNLLKELLNRFVIYGFVDFVKFLTRILEIKIKAYLCMGFDSVKGVCKKLDIPYEIAENPNHQEFINRLKENDFDMILSIACPHIMKKPVLNVPILGCLNYHMAMLPENRGRQPLFWALYYEQKKTGVTVHWIDEGIDNGKILCQKEFLIEGIKKLDVLYIKALVVGADLLNLAMLLVQDNKFVRLENDMSKSTYNSFPDKVTAKKYRAKGLSFF